jgi:hypothetical protein
MGHTENDTYNNSSIVLCVFNDEGTFLPSRCLAMMGRGGYTYRHTGLHYFGFEELGGCKNTQTAW